MKGIFAHGAISKLLQTAIEFDKHGERSRQFEFRSIRGILIQTHTDRDRQVHNKPQVSLENRRMRHCLFPRGGGLTH